MLQQFQKVVKARLQMDDLSNPGTLAGNPGPPDMNPGPPDVNPGPPEYSVSESARMLARDAAKDKEMLQHFLSELKSVEGGKLRDILSKLKSSDLSGLDDVLSEYEKMLNKESKQDHKLDTLDQRQRLSLGDAELESTMDAIQAGGSGAKALAFAIMMAVAEAGGDLTIGGMLGAIRGEINKRARRRKRAGLGAAVLILLPGLFFGIRFLNPPTGKPGSVQAIPPNANLIRSTITPTCSLDLVNPNSADQIPETGPLNVQWSNVPGAASYALKMIPPPSFSAPWLFQSQGTTRTIYMENFTAAGDYGISVEALDPSGGVLCGTELKFTRAALVAPSGKKGDTGPGGCSSTGIMVICP